MGVFDSDSDFGGDFFVDAIVIKGKLGLRALHFLCKV